MKLRINKQSLADMPAEIATHVRAWGVRYRKAFVNLSIQSSVFVQEDGRYTAFSADLSRSTTARGAGEFAGFTGMRPTDKIDIAPGCTLIEEQIFCGLPVLHIYHNPGTGRDAFGCVGLRDTSASLVRAG